MQFHQRINEDKFAEYLLNVSKDTVLNVWTYEMFVQICGKALSRSTEKKVVKFTVGTLECLILYKDNEFVCVAGEGVISFQCTQLYTAYNIVADIGYDIENL